MIAKCLAEMGIHAAAKFLEPGAAAPIKMLTAVKIISIAAVLIFIAWEQEAHGAREVCLERLLKLVS